jgi:twitching motility protein PilT
LTCGIFNRETRETHENKPGKPDISRLAFGAEWITFSRMELFNKILKTAVDGGASDIHIKVGTPVIFRISRELISIDCPIPTVEWLNNVVEKMTPPHQKKKLDEDREVDFSYYVPELGRFRTNVFQQRGTWALAMRHVKSSVPSFAQLGLLEQIKTIAESPRGIVLIAGSTGSGKSTTLAAMIEHINSNFKKHIVTLEDPIEFVFEDNQSVIEQREIGLDTSSFHGALKHVLRQDPDIIMLGEMRDAVTFTAAMSAADTGHLVFSTLHTTTAAQSVMRILDFFKADEREQVRRQLAGTLRGVVCQRMVPTIDGKMTPALEIMINSPVVRKMIEENRLDKLSAAIETGIDDGMLTFNQCLFNLTKAGRITEKEALAKASNPQALEMNFKGIFLNEGGRIVG